MGSAKFKEVDFKGWLAYQYCRFPYNNDIYPKIVRPAWNLPSNVPPGTHRRYYSACQNCGNLDLLYDAEVDHTSRLLQDLGQLQEAEQYGQGRLTSGQQSRQGHLKLENEYHGPSAQDLPRTNSQGTRPATGL